MFRIVLFIMFFQLSSQVSITAQISKLESNNGNTLWYNFEEWLLSNSNYSFRTLDFGTFEAYLPGYTYGLEENISIKINRLEYRTRWINNDLITLPNFNYTEIDSVILSNGITDFSKGEISTNQIKIYTRKTGNYLAGEFGMLNQIGDPGILFNSPNVEFVNFPTNLSTNLTYKNYTLFAAFNSELYSRTSRVVGNREIDLTLYNRTLPFEDGDFNQVQRNEQNNILLIQSLKTKPLNLSLLLGHYYSSRFYEWFDILGIEAPYQLTQNQLSVNLNLNKSTFHNGTSLSFSDTKSDTLDEFKGPYNIQLSERYFSHRTDFQLNKNEVLGSISIANDYYAVRDRSTGKLYQDHSISTTITGNLRPQLDYKLTIGNYTQALNFRYSASENIKFSLNNSFKQLNVNQYNYSLLANGIGFAEINSNEKVLNIESDFENRFSEIATNYTTSKLSYSYSTTLRFTHFWKLTNLDNNFSLVNNDLELNSNIHLSDSYNDGILSFQKYFGYSSSKYLRFTTMLSGNFFLYGNSILRDQYKSIPNFMFTEKVQLIPDKNFIIEIVYKYIPQRTFVEYTNIQNENGWPEIYTNPISLLNLSSKMKFFDSFAELKFTLRNLLNSTEVYDTNGMNYYMSIYVSGKINLRY
jgi:hypothetical protein